MKESSRQRHTMRVWILTLLGLAIAFGVPELNLGHRLAPGSSIGAGLARESVWWVIAAVMLADVLQVERRPLSSIGLRRPGGRTVLFGFIGAVVMFASVVLSYSVIFPLLGLKMNQEAISQITRNPLWLQVLIFACAAVTEEIFYRGYPMERAQELVDGVPRARRAHGEISHKNQVSPAQRDPGEAADILPHQPVALIASHSSANQLCYPLVR